MTYEEAKTRYPKEKDSVQPPISRIPVKLREIFNNGGMVLENMQNGELCISFAASKAKSLTVGEKYTLVWAVEKIDGSYTQVLALKDYIPTTSAKGEGETIIDGGEDWLTTEQVADILGLKRQTVQVYVLRDKFPGARKVNNVYLIPRAAIDEYKDNLAKAKEERAKSRREPRSKSAKEKLERMLLHEKLTAAIANEKLKREELRAVMEDVAATLEKL